jgi:hypothetical protein
MKLKAEMGAWSSVVGGGVLLVADDGRMAGQIAFLCHDDALRDKSTQEQLARLCCDAINGTRAPLSPAVLAELPEVQALADDLASCIAMIQHAIGQGKDTFIEPDTKRKLSDARTRLETFRAAAIREGRG